MSDNPKDYLPDEAYYIQCESCEEWFSKKEMVEVEDDVFLCEECYERMEV